MSVSGALCNLKLISQLHRQDMTYHRLTVHINTLQCNEVVTVLQCDCREESAACVVQARVLVSKKKSK